MIHAQRRWSKAIDSRLWPYALRKANDSLNNTIHKDRKESALERFSKVKVRVNVKDEHPFGCPAYALDSDLQNRKSIDKWSNRARMAIYLGPSPQHASTVGLLLSLKTGLVSPQFHVQYDDTFETVKGIADHLLPPSLWQSKCGFSKSLDQEPLTAANSEGGAGTISVPINDGEVGIVPATELREDTVQDVSGDADADDLMGAIPPMPPEPTEPARTITRSTRSGRSVRAPSRYEEYVVYSVLETPPYVVTGMEFEEVTTPSVAYDKIEYDHVIEYAASTDPDVLYMHEAMKAADKAQFVKAMEDEVRAHTENGHWKIIKRTEVPSGTKVLPAVWAMRRKRRTETQEV
jgi:hypothetical protein